MDIGCLLQALVWKQNKVTASDKVAVYIDPPSHHFLGDRLFEVDAHSHLGEDMQAPYLALKAFLDKRSIPVHTADYLPGTIGTTHNIYISMGSLKNYKKLSARPDVTTSAFFSMECPIVDPAMYRKLGKAQRYFKRIFSWSDSASLERFTGDPLKCESFKWPQSYEQVHETLWNNKDRKFMIMINSNKLPRIYWQELYTERMRAVEYFSRTDDIDLYGHEWDLPSYKLGVSWIPYTLRLAHRKVVHQWHRFYPNPLLVAARSVYKGSVESKSETLSQYTFALCYENMILKGWITEKIFDCFFSGTIPVYLGAPDITDYVPENCFIDKRHFGSYEELKTRMKSLTDDEIGAYRENAKNFITSEKFSSFRKKTFVDIFRRIIEEDAGICL